MVPSLPAVARGRPAGLKATPSTRPIWPRSGRPRAERARRFQTRTMPSSPALATTYLLELKATRRNASAYADRASDREEATLSVLVTWGRVSLRMTATTTAVEIAAAIVAVRARLAGEIASVDAVRIRPVSGPVRRRPRLSTAQVVAMAQVTATISGSAT